MTTTPRARSSPVLACAVFVLASFLHSTVSRAEDGYELWLRYRPISDQWREAYRSAATELVSGSNSPTLKIARAELSRGLSGLLDVELPDVAAPDRDGAIVFGTPSSSAVVRRLSLPLKPAGDEGYLLRTLEYQGRRTTVIAANTDVGVLYGVFHFLRLLQTRQPVSSLDLLSAPRLRYRFLDHWDNLDRTVERGYAGQSIFDWQKLPDYLDPRYADYARACASIGINGTVPTNVNASPIGLRTDYLKKYAALATVFRPYGLRVYLTVRFSAPIEIGGLRTADPLDGAVRNWWRAKIEEIYALIPDFGGLLIKANSEGQPGPQDYGRSHADGANMLAALLAPHGGILMWRAFVYSPRLSQDRAMQAFSEFQPLDGRFVENALLQVKNGPIDFQPREPFHPLFGRMPHTATMMEVQITKEYLGFATHLVYLGPLFEETLRSDTYVHGQGSTVARVLDGSLFGTRPTGMSGVANIGSDRNWTGSHFDQANWYAFGRMAWDPMAPSREIAADWVSMTFSTEDGVVAPIVGMMMTSREAAVDYMTPLGLHHQMADGHHYGPAPWFRGGPRADWTPVYFNKADKDGIGFDRTTLGSGAVTQYAAQVAARYSRPDEVPETLLLWFHHLPWDYRMKSGRTLWDELVMHYSQGVQAVSAMRETWATLATHIDRERFDQVSAFLAIQEKEARWWRDASIAYFQSLSGRPLPAGYAAPEHDLAYYEALCFPYAPGHAALSWSECN